MYFIHNGQRTHESPVLKGTRLTSVHSHSGDVTPSWNIIHPNYTQIAMGALSKVMSTFILQ